MMRRHSFAMLIRDRVAQPGARVAGTPKELEALASELEDDELSLDPASAVACRRLLSDATQSALLNPALPSEDLRSRVTQIRSGFRRSRLAA